MKKLIIILSALTLLLCGCSVPAGSSKVDYGSFEGYYSNLAYEVKNEDDSVAEQFYVLYSDEEMEHAVGTKDVFFEDDRLMRYSVTIGVKDVEQLVTYNAGEDSSYYSVMYFEDGKLTRTEWENEYSDENGDSMRSTGYEIYHPDGRTVKTFREELSRNGEIDTVTTRERAEDGTVTSETIE